MFKRHPNFKIMKFIIDPDMREALDITPCSIPSSFDEVIENYINILPNKPDY